MSRYIDAEKAEKDGWSASRIYQYDAKTNVYETKKMTDFPTADVVEVVRCKDCLYWKRETEPIGIECEPGETSHYCSFSGITRSNEFCCWGINESKMLKAFEKIRKRREKKNEEQQGKGRSEEGSGDPEA